MNAGGYRGAYNCAYTGTITALAGAPGLMLGGFHVVRLVAGRADADLPPAGVTRFGAIAGIAMLPRRNPGRSKNVMASSMFARCQDTR